MWSETLLRVNIYGKWRGIKLLEYFITRLFSSGVYHDHASFCLLDIQYIGRLMGDERYVYYYKWML